MKKKMNGNEAMTDQQKSQAVMSKIGELHRKIHTLKQEEISQKHHVIYALRADPDYMVFDAELLDLSVGFIRYIPKRWSTECAKSVLLVCFGAGLVDDPSYSRSQVSVRAIGSYEGAVDLAFIELSASARHLPAERAIGYRDDQGEALIRRSRESRCGVRRVASARWERCAKATTGAEYPLLAPKVDLDLLTAARLADIGSDLVRRWQSI